MPNPVRETYPTDREDLLVLVTDDGSRTFLKRGSDDAFHSGSGAATETRHVYLKNSGVADRLKVQRPTRVLEIGLGTSMAMLMTIDDAVSHDAELDYVAIETDWVSANTLNFLRPRDWISRAAIVESYIAFRNSLPNDIGPGDFVWEFDSRRRVTIQVVDARDWDNASNEPFHAIYFDPFCPDSAPELWTTSCMERLRSVIHDGGRLTTYSCSRPVREALEQARWEVRRVSGPPGGKRQVMVASPAVDQ